MRNKIIAVLLCVLIIGGIIFMHEYGNTLDFTVEQREKPITNPLKGWVYGAKNEGFVQEATLALAVINWKEVEAKKGVYDFTSMEKTYHFAQLKQKGVRLILRIVSDYPDAKNSKNMSIPQWLYDEMKGDGQWYNNSYGYGFSPNYNNKVFMAAHSRLLKAFGQRYNEDKSVAFIQIGSIGHWGEWHINYGEGLQKLPKSTVTDGYVKDYLLNFSNKKLMMRRPYQIAKDNNLGLYNDSFADKESTEEWLSWIEQGYTSDQNQEKHPSMSGYWMEGPVGGEFASYEDLEYYIGQKYSKTYQQMVDSHMSFIGPNAPVYISQTNDLNDNIAQLSRDMGYCITVKKVKVYNLKVNKGDLELKMTWSNIGIAPIYQNWPVKVMLVNEKNKLVAEKFLDTDITNWVKGDYTQTITLPNTKALADGTYKICVAIIDPMTNKPAIHMPIKNQYSDCVYSIAEFTKPIQDN